MDEGERNYCCLVILLSRVAVQTLRHHFILEWNGVGRFMPWTDCAQNGRDLLTKFKPLPYEKHKVKSGDTTWWDLSLLVKALLNTRPPFVTTKCLVKSLECLRETRNTVSHTPNGKITTADFKKLWSAACNALAVFGATKQDFKKVKQDVKLPWNELTSLMKQCAKQDDDILRSLDTVITRLDILVQGQDEMKDGQKEMKTGQEEIKKGQDEMKKGQEEMKKGQDEVKERQEEMKKGQDEVKEQQKEMKKGQDEVKKGQAEMKKGQDEVKERQKEMKKEQEEIKDKIDQVLDASSTRQIQLSTEDVQLRSKYLKTSTKRQTEFQPKLMASHSIASARTDQIFTNLMMQYGRKSLPKGASRMEQLSEYRTLSGTPIEKSQDIFIPQQNGRTYPKSILVTGKPGIGKSLFCQKLVRDWADDVLFEEQPQTKAHGFDFVYLLPFRQLNLIEEEKLTLREVLNRCSLLDERSDIDETLFEYMIEHPAKVLFILDGYDEYVHRENITGNRVDQNHGSNPRIAMPVSALLSKLLKGKLFGEAVVVVTSRSTESNELGGMNFDALVEIAGFSPQQVEEFIAKYFQSNSQMMNDVLGYVMENEDLVSLAHVPMFCFLICWCMEWHMKFKTDQDFPVNMTELYSEVVEIFELKHHSKSQYRSEQIPEQFECPDVVKTTLEKLSMLAAETMKTKKFIFEEEELTNFGLVSKEIEELKVSGLLTSGPGLRTSATKITRYYCFSHLTLHEYLTARWYVENGKIPLYLKEIHSEMVLQFVAGLFGKAKSEDLMETLLLHISGGLVSRQQTLLLILFYEYDDEHFQLRMLKKHYSRSLFFNLDGSVSANHKYIFYGGCKIASFYINLLNLFCKPNNELVRNALSLSNEIMVYKIDFSTLNTYMSLAGMKRVCKALSNPFCPITSVSVDSGFRGKLDCLLNALPSTNITFVHFSLVDEYNSTLMRLREALLDPNCKVKTLRLHGNVSDIVKVKMMSDKLQHFKQKMERSKPEIKIHVSDPISVL